MNARLVYGVVCLVFGVLIIIEGFANHAYLSFSDRVLVSVGGSVIGFIGACFIDAGLLDRHDRRLAEREAAAGKEEENQRREWSRNPPKTRKYYTDM